MGGVGGFYDGVGFEIRFQRKKWLLGSDFSKISPLDLSNFCIKHYYIFIIYKSGIKSNFCTWNLIHFLWKVIYWVQFNFNLEVVTWHGMNKLDLVGRMKNMSRFWEIFPPRGRTKIPGGETHRRSYDIVAWTQPLATWTQHLETWTPPLATLPWSMDTASSSMDTASSNLGNASRSLDTASSPSSNLDTAYSSLDTCGHSL